MSKRLIKLASVLLVCCLLSAMTPVASAASDSSTVLTSENGGSTVYYMVTGDNEVEVCSSSAPSLTNPSSYTGEITIPASITVDGTTYSVTGVGNGAFESSTVTKVTLPNSIEYIGNAAFWKAGQLKEVVLQEGLKTISGVAFQECSNLTTLNIPSTVTEIGSSAFWQCESLTSLTIPAGVTEIKDKVFYGCSKLSELNILGAVTSIGNQAFAGCPASNLTIPQTVTHIGTGAFLGCGATSLTIPEGVTEGLAKALLGYEHVDGIILPENSSYKIDSGVLYHGTVLEAVLDRKISTLTVLPGTTEIAAGVCAADKGITSGVAVSACGDLVTIVVPESVQKIGTNAFNGALKSPGSTLIMMGEKPPEIERLWTGGRDNNIPTEENLTVIIPAGSEDAYKNNNTFERYILSEDETKPDITYGLTLDNTALTEGNTYTPAITVPTDAAVDVSSSDTNVATAVYADGVLTVTGVKAGSATITASIKLNNVTLVSKKCTVTVTTAPVPATGITLNQNSLFLYSNTTPNTATLTAIVKPSNSTSTVVWTSSNTNVATVSNGVVTAVGNGTATITAKAGDYSATCVVTVERYSSGGGSSDSSGYSVSVPSSSSIKNGSISVSPRTADKGDTVTITVKPDAGYELDELIVTDSKGNELRLTDRGNDKYSFTMPASRVSIEVSFAKINDDPTPSTGFVDVAESAYYYDAVAWAVENGITSGTTATTFSPDASCTRAQMVTFLWRAAGSPRATGANPFTDLDSSAYYYEAVLWAVENGITAGTSATTFSPDAIVPRGQTVTFLYRANGSPAASGSSFSDVSADAYYANAVAWAVAESITSGTSATTFGPDQSCTRAQIMTFLYRANA